METLRWLPGVFRKWTQFHTHLQLSDKHKNANHNATLSWGKNICKMIRNHCLISRAPEPSLASIYWRSVEILRAPFFFGRSSSWWCSRKTQSLTKTLFYLFPHRIASFIELFFEQQRDLLLLFQLFKRKIIFLELCTYSGACVKMSVLQLTRDSRPRGKRFFLAVGPIKIPHQPHLSDKDTPTTAGMDTPGTRGY